MKNSDIADHACVQGAGRWDIVGSVERFAA
jgi:hypothetical protein